MDTVQEAKNLLLSTEVHLRQLMEHGLREQRYADVAEIAGLAQGIAQLMQGHGRVTSAEIPAASTAIPRPMTAPAQASSKKNIGKPNKGEYPRFERDGSRLVKIGWSKKFREEYEHRAPLSVATSLLSAIRTKVRDGELFTATDVIPLRIGDDMMPDYQAYLALKWFHSEGIVTKHPRDHYSVEPGRLGPNGLEEYWLRLPTVKGSKSGGSK